MARRWVELAAPAVNVRRGVPLAGAAFIVCAGLLGCAAGESRETAEYTLRAALERQAEAWNRGDIDEYMRYYDPSERLTFSSGGVTHRGWQKTYQRYKDKYPTPERMGRVSFSDLEIHVLGSAWNHAYVLGRWFLQRESDPVGGNFTLVMSRVKGEWSILHDHTSVDPAAK